MPAKAGTQAEGWGRGAVARIEFTTKDTKNTKNTKGASRLTTLWS
jgi:hypothetical protein